MSAASPPPPGERRSETQNIATAITEVSERATLLVREEIELAKTEVAEKATKLVKGAVVGIAAGIFLDHRALLRADRVCLAALLLPSDRQRFTYFYGFFAMAIILVVLGVIAGLIAARVVKKGSPPVPSMAIEEAQKIRETVSAGADSHAMTGGKI